MPSIEERWGDYCKSIAIYAAAIGDYAHDAHASDTAARTALRLRAVEANDNATDAARALALAVLESYVADVDRVAEADVIADNPLEGAHYRAMRTVADEHRARIKELGKEGR